MRRTQHLVYRVVNDSGVKQLTQISELWTPWRADKPAIRARVITLDGTAHLLDPNTIAETGIPTQLEGVYSHVKVLAAPLPAVAPGAVVEEEIESNDRETVNPGGVLDRLGLLGDIPVQYLKLTLEAPAGVPLHIEERRFPKLERKETSSGNTRRVELSASDFVMSKAIPMAPPEAAGNPLILVSDVPDWQQVAKWYFGVAERQIGVPPPAPDPNSDPATRLAEIETILAGIQKQVRYTGVELGFAAIEPRTPAETLSRGYGDCKDKAILLVSRLRAAGIAASVALLTPWPSPDVAPAVPGMEAFSHAIVYVPGKHSLWIDPTAEFAPARRLPWADQGRLALIVDPQARDLTRTPESSASDETSIDATTLTLSEEGKSRIEEAREDSGGMEDYMRPLALAGSQTTENRRESVIQQFQQQFGSGKVKSIDWGNPRDLSKPSRITVIAEDAPGSGTTGQAVYATIKGIGDTPIQLASLLSTLTAEKNLPDAKSRTEDYWLPAAFTVENRYRVVPPQGFRLRQLPEVKDLPYGPLTIYRKVSLDPDGSVLFVYRIEGIRRFTTAQAKSFLAAAENTRAESYRLEFMAEGSLLMSQGK